MDRVNKFNTSTEYIASSGGNVFFKNELCFSC